MIFGTPLHFYKRHTRLVIDIGSGSISAAVIRSDSANKPHIVKVFRYPLTLVSDGLIDHKKVWAQLRGAVTDAIRAVDRYIGQPDSVRVAVSPPFIRGTTSNITRKRSAHLKITDHEIQSIVKEEQKKHSSEGVEPFEAFMMKVLINGYVVDNPVGLQGNEFQAPIRFGFMSTNLRRVLNDTVLSRWHNISLELISSPVAIFKFLTIVYPNLKEYLVIDCGAEFTDYIFVRNGFITSVHTVPKGVNFFVRRIVSRSKIGFNEAKTFLKMYIAGTLESTRRDQLQAVFESSWNDFEHDVRTAIDSTDAMIPGRIFMTGGGAIISPIVDGFKKACSVTASSKDSFQIMDVSAFKDYFVPPFSFSSPSDIVLLSATVIK